MDVSSAYWQSLCSFFPSFIPLTFLSSLKANAKYSEHSMKMYGEIGSPCLHPLSKRKGSDRCPFRIILEFEFNWNICIHFLRFGPKLNLSKTSSMNSQDKLSKAFWKSTNRISPLLFANSVSVIISYISLEQSAIDLFSKNPFCSWLIILFSRGLILFIMQREINLYEVLSSEIGR